MKTKNQLTKHILAVTSSRWLQPAMLTLVVAVVLIGIGGCTPHH